MNDKLEILISELEEISENAQNSFGILSTEQINWRPSAEAWSVGQCFEHLMKTNQLFFPELEQIASGERKNSFLENYSPLSGFFGNLMVKSLRKDERKFKAPTSEIVPPSEVSKDIINRFATHHEKMIEKIRLTADSDWEKTIITSPFMKLMTYKLVDGFRIIVEHERRHLRQAERVRRAKGFPK